MSSRSRAHPAYGQPAACGIRRPRVPADDGPATSVTPASPSGIPDETELRAA
ncbi:hypothetical protein G9U51_13185 [Calidifontibacter sp. DB0510]|uniref:Uncharacterized protein n=1 Tax=Metallococcus carri TaxID=1656884 RepID=A0A967EHP4_9MICO|nr:hypothetical protein [Metallococcus carri]NHN56733.1 hypothetical protein [Metallococcus carri]NOP37890.1 hypothetical protein [Calidifontibacter sp. DB2511S]